MSPILGIWASQISGRLWQPTGSYDNLATVAVPAAGSAASVVFTGIPQDYKHLQIRGIASAATGTAEPTLNIRFNGITTATYAVHYLWGDGSTIYGSSNAPNNTLINLFNITGNTGTANTYGAFIIDVLDYSNSTKYKTLRALSGEDQNGFGTIALNSGLATSSTNPITSITLYANSNLSQYSHFALYGIK